MSGTIDLKYVVDKAYTNMGIKDEEKEIHTVMQSAICKNIVYLTANSDFGGINHSPCYCGKATGLNYTLSAVKYAIFAAAWGAKNLLLPAFKSVDMTVQSSGYGNVSISFDKGVSTKILGDTAFNKNRQDLLLIDAMITGVDTYKIHPMDMIADVQALKLNTVKEKQTDTLSKYIERLLKLELPSCYLAKTKSGYSLLSKKDGKEITGDNVTDAEYNLFVLLEYFSLKDVVKKNLWCLLFWDCSGLPREVVDTFLLAFTKTANVTIFLYNYDKTTVTGGEHSSLNTLVTRMIQHYDLPPINRFANISNMIKGNLAKQNNTGIM